MRSRATWTERGFETGTARRRVAAEPRLKGAIALPACSRNERLCPLSVADGDQPVRETGVEIGGADAGEAVLVVGLATVPMPTVATLSNTAASAESTAPCICARDTEPADR